MILTNMDCNLCCSYCYETHKENKINDPVLCCRFLDGMFRKDFGAPDADKNYRVVLDFIGGETLMHPDLLDKIADHFKVLCKRYGVADWLMSVTTNGTRFEDPAVRDFCLKWKPRLYVGFSIDGTKEIHDACRIDHAGRGSYDRAVAGWRWAQQNLCYWETGVKATFTHKTIGKYADSVINLIQLGFPYISANVVFEEIWKPEEAPEITAQMIRVADYLFDNGLQDKVHVWQINNADMNMEFYNPVMVRTHNHCGACDPMRSLGFDGEIFGCQRFSTMPHPRPIGKLTDDGEIEITQEGVQLIHDVVNEWKLWPQECKDCKLGGSCPACAAIPYEQCPDNPAEFFRRKGQCGFTYAMAAARLYFSQRLKAIKNEKNR